MTVLPTGWTLCEMGDVLEPVEKTGKHEQDREIWYVDISSIDNESNRITAPKRLTLSKAPSRARQKIRSGDVLFSTVRPYLRNIAPVDRRFDGEIASTGFAVLRGCEGIDPRYLLYKSISHDFVSALTGEQYGVSYPAVKAEQVRVRPLELPPTNEQRRIVEKIEVLFDEIDRGVGNLRTAKSALDLYRKSLLKSAFEGRLTADWRARNPEKLESPETLLARIRDERKARQQVALDDWEKALAKWRSDGRKGKRPAKPKPQPKLEMLAPPFEIPMRWMTLALGSLGRVRTGATPSTRQKKNFGGNVPFFKPTDLDSGANVRESRVFLSQTGALASRSFPAGTILVTCIGATIGKTGLATVDAACNQQINFLEPHPSILPKFAYYQIVAPFFQTQIKSNASSTTLPILNKGKFSKLPAVVCVPTEQAEIVRLLEARLEITDFVEAEIDAMLARADVLRQSILNKAFAGQLVPQDPTDESAVALLKRIKSKPSHTTENRRKRLVNA